MGVSEGCRTVKNIDDAIETVYSADIVAATLSSKGSVEVSVSWHWRQGNKARSKAESQGVRLQLGWVTSQWKSQGNRSRGYILWSGTRVVDT